MIPINHENPPIGAHAQVGNVTQDSNGYDEPSRSTGNQSFTDYAQDPAVKQNRRQSSFALGVQD